MYQISNAHNFIYYCSCLKLALLCNTGRIHLVDLLVRVEGIDLHPPSFNEGDEVPCPCLQRNDEDLVPVPVHRVEMGIWSTSLSLAPQWQLTVILLFAAEDAKCSSKMSRSSERFSTRRYPSRILSNGCNRIIPIVERHFRTRIHFHTTATTIAVAIAIRPATVDNLPFIPKIRGAFDIPNAQIFHVRRK